MSSSNDDDSTDSSSDEEEFRGFTNHRKRQRNSYSSVHDNTTALLKSCDENNILPLVDANLTCAACVKRVEKPHKHVIECCSCRKKFHATCKEVDLVGNRHKLKVMPCKTDIMHFNSIMKQNEAWLGGKFSWSCNSCVTLQSISDKKYLGDRLALIESMLIKDKPLKAVLEDLIAKLDTSGIVNSNRTDYSLSTDREMQECSSTAAVPSSYANVTSAQNQQLSPPAPTMQSSFSLIQTEQQQQQRNIGKDKQITRKSQANKSFRIHISNKVENAPPIGAALDKLTVQGALAKYDSRSRGKDNIDLLFEDYDKAKAEFEKVKNTLSDFEVHNPELINGKKAFLVGLGDYHTPESVLSAIKEEYSSLLGQAGDINSVKILEIKPCLKDQTVFRATLYMPDSMLDLIQSRLNSKLYIGYLRCTVYPYKPHIRCFHCQQHGHMKSKCKNNLCCAKCGGEHDTDKCTNIIVNCVNCANSADHKDACSSHRADSYECPVFIKYRREQTKN